MKCVVARLSKQSSGVPGVLAGLIHVSLVRGGDRMCDVSCGLGHRRTCHFDVSTLRDLYFCEGRISFTNFVCLVRGMLGVCQIWASGIWRSSA